MWKDVSNYEGYYQVNEFGQIRSCRKILKHYINKRGYHVVTLKTPYRRQTVYEHRVVATAFLNGKGQTVNHKNGNKNDNSVENLEYMTYAENNMHAYNTGLHKKGEGHYKSKLTNDEVKEIKSLGKYATYEEIGQKYGVSKATIRDVLLCRTWK